MNRLWHFPTKVNARDIQKCNWFWVPSVMICSPPVVKQCFSRQRRPAFIAWPITSFFQPVKSSEIENETVNGVEAEAEAMEFENGERCFMQLVRA